MSRRETGGPVQVTFTPQVLDQAIEWLVKTGSGAASPRVHTECEQWRAADASHEAAWQALQVAESTFRQASTLPGGVALETLAGSDRLRSRRQTLKVLGLGLLGTGAGGLLVHQPWRTFGADYTTGVGERRLFNLADGTRLQLNTDSAADVLFSEQQRLVVLRAGEIFIRTGGDSDFAPGRRPFWVQTREAQLQAIGTAFDVRQVPAGTRLMVEEGVVAVHRPHSGPPLLVQAGSEYLIDARSAQLQVSPGWYASGWARGALVARQMSLQDLAGELSRYRHGWLNCDPAVAQLRVSGVFQLEHIDLALDSLSQSLAVRIERRTRFWTRIVAA